MVNVVDGPVPGLPVAGVLPLGVWLADGVKLGEASTDADGGAEEATVCFGDAVRVQPTVAPIAASATNPPTNPATCRADARGRGDAAEAEVASVSSGETGGEELTP
jgi:hypothetical protein